MTSSDHSALFKTRHWVVTGGSGAEFVGLLSGIDRLMTANLAIDGLGRQLLQLRYRSSTHVAVLTPTENAFVVSGIAGEAGELSVTPAVRAVDARQSLVFDLLDLGTEILVADTPDRTPSLVLRLGDDREISLDLLAWHVPFPTRTALIVHEYCGFHPVETEQALGLQQAAFARHGATSTIVFSRFRNGREFFEIRWNRSGFDVQGVFEDPDQAGHWPDEQPLIPEFPDRPIDEGDSFSVSVNDDDIFEFHNTTKDWSYLMVPADVQRRRNQEPN